MSLLSELRILDIQYKIDCRNYLVHQERNLQRIYLGKFNSILHGFFKTTACFRSLHS